MAEEFDEPPPWLPGPIGPVITPPNQGNQDPKGGDERA
jgi:hypothetical protein